MDADTEQEQNTANSSADTDPNRPATDAPTNDGTNEGCASPSADTSQERRQSTEGEPTDAAIGASSAEPAPATAQTSPNSQRPKDKTTPSNKKRGKNRRSKFPPPARDLIIGYHENDVLCGRGATVNVHPGNTRFRNMCALRKSEFEVASIAGKRSIAVEVVEAVIALKPPGRFLERVGKNEFKVSNADDEVMTIDEADVDKVLLLGLTGRNAKFFSEVGLDATNKRLRRELGPWRDIGWEKAIQKTCGVIRDHGRVDKIAFRAMGLLNKPRKRKSEEISMQLEATADGNSNQHITEQDTTDSKKSNPPKPNKNNTTIIPTPNDVIIGRGSFINSHAGNKQFRRLALQRKANFNAGKAREKKDISLELVNAVHNLDPPGRFLIRASHAQTSPILLKNGKYKLPPRGLEGPWEEVDREKAVSKACQVLRDLKGKPEEKDRIAPDSVGENSNSKSDDGPSSHKVSQVDALDDDHKIENDGACDENPENDAQTELPEQSNLKSDEELIEDTILNLQESTSDVDTDAYVPVEV